MSKIQAVVFDMDGVLVDSEVLWRQVREEFARDLGKVWDADSQVATMGVSTRDWSRIMQERMALDMSCEEIARQIKSRLIQHYEQHLPVRPGALEAVRTAASRYKVALASASPTELVYWIMDYTGLRPLFQAVGLGDEVRRGKPDPEIYLKVLADLGVHPENAVGVEDSGNGIRAVHAAGMHVIAAPSPEFQLPAEIAAMADRVIHSLEEFSLEMVEGLER